MPLAWAGSEERERDVVAVIGLLQLARPGCRGATADSCHFFSGRWPPNVFWGAGSPNSPIMVIILPPPIPSASLSLPPLINIKM